MTIKDAERHITDQLQGIYDRGEAARMADWLLENITGTKRTERVSERGLSLSNEQMEDIYSLTKRLLRHEPIQYVLNEAWFSGLKFYVDKNVLIPRPETEELVEWICKDIPAHARHKIHVLDIGTGSGCIPIALKKRMSNVELWAVDSSTGALEVAKKNAASLDAIINFIRLDFLDKNSWSQLPVFDIIVSNPPYVPEKDKPTIDPNVLDYEPATALFVPDNDPLVFYKAIAEFGKTHLNVGGAIYVEIHETLGEATLALLRSGGYATELRKDMQGRDRMIKACLR